MNTKNLQTGIILSFFIGILLLWMSPEDRTLGPKIKLIYLHGALIFTGLSQFTAAGLVSLIMLYRNSRNFSLLFAIERTAIVFWVAATIVGDITSQLAWGGLFWGEPRFIATIIISLASLGIYFVSTAVENPKIISLLGLVMALSVWVLMAGAGKVMHPDNPFGVSEPSIKLVFGLITVVFLIASILTVRWMVKKGT